MTGMTKWPSWPNEKMSVMASMTKCQNVKMSKCQNVKMSKYQSADMLLGQSANVSKCQHVGTHVFTSPTWQFSFCGRNKTLMVTQWSRQNRPTSYALSPWRTLLVTPLVRCDSPKLLPWFIFKSFDLLLRLSCDFYTIYKLRRASWEGQRLGNDW